MNTLVLIGLALVVTGFVLFAMRLAPRVRRQFAATAVQPRTVADLVRLREETGAPAVPAAAPPRRTPAPVAARPEPSRVAPQVSAAAPATPAPEPPAPAFVPPPPRPTPVAGRVRRESAEPPSPPLDGDNSPWQRGARMAVGLGGGQPWREPPAPPAPLRIVPAAEPEPPAQVEAAAPVEPAEPEAPVDHAPVRLVPTESESLAPAPDTSDEQVPVRLVPAEPVPAEQPVEPAPAQPAAPRQAVWIEPGAVAEQDAPRSAEPAVATEPASSEPPAPAATGTPEPENGEQATTGGPAARREPAEEPTEAEIPIPDGWDDVEAEDVPAGAVPERFAEERPAAPDAEAGRRRSRQTPDERAAEQAAADLALLRTFGFADPGLRPDSAPVVAMEGPEEPEVPTQAGAAQPVRYRVVRRDGSVVGGATVTLLDDRGGDVAAGAADAEGQGEVLAPSPGGYVLVSTAAGHQPGAVAITVAGSAAETDVLIARSASVSGSVHGEDGPIAGARVTLVQDGEAVDAVDTGADGTYRISDIGAGEYGLSVAAAGCEPVATLLDVAEEADVRHDAELRPASPVADGDLVEDDAMSELASESMSQRLREAPAEPRGTVAGGAGGVGKHSEAVR
jgi:carboxypeptidase family protein